jgi:peptide/nickel transport system permease protein
MVGVAILLFITVVAIAAPVTAPHDPQTQYITARLEPPIWAGGTAEFLFGTDNLGRDVLSRLIHGARISLLVGFSTVAIAGTVGLIVGLISGYVGGRVDAVIQTIAYGQLSVPVILVALAIIAVFGQGLVNVIVVLALAGWVPFCRIVRGTVLSTKERQFVEAARMIGGSDRWIVRQHILPQALGVFLLLAAMQVGWMIEFESALSFLGLGVQPPTPTWGNMISDARNYIYASPWLAVFPGLAIAITVLAVNAAGRWLVELMDPKSRA